MRACWGIFRRVEGKAYLIFVFTISLMPVSVGKTLGLLFLRMLTVTSVGNIKLYPYDVPWETPNFYLVLLCYNNKKTVMTA